MAFSELVKNFSRIRDYMREFYVYGFKSREEYTRKSARSYDDERRRLESWLGDYMHFRQTPEGKNVFLSIDSRLSRRNPLYKAWKAKSFTDGDITLHFILMDILSRPDKSLPLSGITENIDALLSGFDRPRIFDESTVRKKLQEYVSEGIVTAEKQGRTMYYRRTADNWRYDPDALAFFSEVSPCGVIGSFLMDRDAGPEDAGKDCFAFKHHYITGAMDSEVVCALLTAMHDRKYVTLKSVNRRNGRTKENQAVPLRIMVSVQNGRQYLMAYTPHSNRIRAFRTDNILSVTAGDLCGNFGELREKLAHMMPHIWGVSTQSGSGSRLEHVEFTIRYTDGEQYIPRRLEREKRCGRVEHPDRNTSRFSADVYDASEMVPWIRTFLCRITDISFSNKKLEAQFKSDIREMYALYGLEGGEDNALQ